jgi:flagellar motor switch protein FliM
MATDFLSQDEVDALLKGVTGESDEPESKDEGDGGIRAYNLGTQERIVRGRMPTLELINERFARYLRIGLFNYMHRTTEISVGPIRVQKYSEFIRNLVVPTNLNLVAPSRCAAHRCSSSTRISSSWSSTTCSAATAASTPGSRDATSRRPSSASSRGC